MAQQLRVGRHKHARCRHRARPARHTRGAATKGAGPRTATGVFMWGHQDRAQHGTARHGAARHGSARRNTARRGTVLDQCARSNWRRTVCSFPDGQRPCAQTPDGFVLQGTTTASHWGHQGTHGEDTAMPGQRLPSWRRRRRVHRHGIPGHLCYVRSHRAACDACTHMRSLVVVRSLVCSFARLPSRFFSLSHVSVPRQNTVSV